MCSKCLAVGAQVCCTCNDDRPRHNTPDEMIEIIKAMKDDKTLEFRDIHAVKSPWLNRGKGIDAPNFKSYQYRVKREPRAVYYRETDTGTMYNYSFNKSAAIEAVNRSGGRVVKFVEVMG